MSVATAKDGGATNMLNNCEPDTKKQLPPPKNQSSCLALKNCWMTGKRHQLRHAWHVGHRVVQPILLLAFARRVFHFANPVNDSLNSASFLSVSLDTRCEETCHAYIDEMIGLYDRCLMLLRFSAQFIDTIATLLEQKQEQQNKIGLGSSAGVVSGVLGVVAAATILTPVGPPLLIASLVFGGSALAVQTSGSDAMNYFLEPNKLADRILSLHGMLHSLLRVTGTLRDGCHDARSYPNRCLCGQARIYGRISSENSRMQASQASATDIGAEVRDNSLRESELNLLV
jgi:hypothetical protein